MTDPDAIRRDAERLLGRAEELVVLGKSGALDAEVVDGRLAVLAALQAMLADELVSAELAAIDRANTAARARRA